MNFEIARNILLWCTAINAGLLLYWFLIFRLAHDRLYGFHRRWFHIPADQFDAIHYKGMAIYKIGIILFNFVPYVALLIVG